MRRISKTHPRLLVGNDGFATLKRNAKSPTGKALAERVLYDAGLLLELPPQPREMLGKRMLMASRNVLYRINTLSVAYHLTGEKKYADRAIHEMRNAAAYPDWNPSHFLDTGEMTLAIAIGYDWLHDLLTPEDREAIAAAIIEKGLRPSYTPQQQWWINGKNNWSPVCHSGMIAGALVVADREPKLAEEVIRRAVAGMPNSMKASYEPNGAYPEGPMYWGYGTEFTTVLLALLNGAFGKDFGLSAGSGFTKTGDYILAATAPSGKWFNYADCNTKRQPSVAMIWLAKRFQRPDWFHGVEQKLLEEYSAARPKQITRGANRLLPLALLFLDIPGKTADAPLAYYSGKKSLVPIAVFRSDHTGNAAWLGVKGGSPSGPHGHMDGGSFVFEAHGHSWAIDLGMENYTKIEATGRDLWNSAQNSERWKLLRLGPVSHNILRIDDAPQNVKGNAVIKRFSLNSVTMDLTTLYAPAAKTITRTAKLLPKRTMQITDRLSGLRPGATVRWQMCTDAEAELLPDGNLLLRHGKNTLTLRKNVPGAWSIIPAESLRAPDESSNPNARMVSFVALAPRSGTLTLEVTFLQ